MEGVLTKTNSLAEGETVATKPKRWPTTVRKYEKMATIKKDNRTRKTPKS